MKKFLIWIVLWSVGVVAGALPVEHRFDTALEKAKAQKKEVMMIYSAPWCPECNYMKEVVFKDPKVAAYIRKRFILLNLDIQKDDLPKGFDYRGIPTFFFLDAKGRLRGKIEGGSKAKLFLRKMKAIP